MPTLVHRFERVSAQASGRRRMHVRGDVRSPVTKDAPQMYDTDGTPLGVEVLAAMPPDELEGIQGRRERDLRKQRGTRPQPFAEFIFVGGRRIGEDWTPKIARDWAKDCMDWMKKRMPDSKIVDAALHCDETQYHVHAIVMPAAVEDGRLRWGLTAVRRVLDSELTGKKQGRLSRGVVGAAVSRLQDDVWKHVGEPYGLERGRKGSVRRHIAVDEIKAAKAHSREARTVLAQTRKRETAVAERESAVAQREVDPEAKARLAQAKAAEVTVKADKKRLATIHRKLKRARDGLALQAEQLDSQREQLDRQAAELEKERDALATAQAEHEKAEAVRLKAEADVKAKRAKVDVELRKIIKQRTRVILAKECIVQSRSYEDDPFAQFEWLERVDVALYGSATELKELRAVVGPQPRMVENTQGKEQEKEKLRPDDPDDNVVKFPERD